MNHVYDFATIGFKPHPSADPVTVGVIVHEVSTRRVFYELFLAEVEQRVRVMFPSLPWETYQNAIADLRQQLDALGHIPDERSEDDPPLALSVNPADPAGMKNDAFFKAIITRRDGLFTFPANGRLMGSSPRQAIEAIRLGFLHHGYIQGTSGPVSIQTGTYDVVVGNPPWAK